MSQMGPTEGPVFPVILSASRATDIPAFYADWFMNRLRSGFFSWVNPFRPSQVQTVSAANVPAIVFWSKHPAGILPHLDELDRRGINNQPTGHAMKKAYLGIDAHKEKTVIAIAFAGREEPVLYGVVLCGKGGWG